MTQQRYRKRNGIAAMMVVAIMVAILAAVSIGGALAVGGVGLGVAANANRPGRAPRPATGQNIHVRVWQDPACEQESGPRSPDSTSVASMPDTTGTTGTENHSPVLINEYVTNGNPGVTTVEGAGGPYEVHQSVYNGKAGEYGAEGTTSGQEGGTSEAGSITNPYENPELAAQPLPVETF